MSVNSPYTDPHQLPDTAPIFPLSCALLLPRGELPLNIFEPRYLAMVDAALAADRIIGMIQPLPGEADDESRPSKLFPIGCAGRITRFSETGDGRYLITLTGVCRFRVVEEQPSLAPFRRCRVSYGEFMSDLDAGAGERAVNRVGMIDMLRRFADASKLEVDWASIHAAPTETLVNALAMMSPFGANEKQALLEAPDLKSRADLLIAFAEFDLAQQQGSDRSQFH